MTHRDGRTRGALLAGVLAALTTAASAAEVLKSLAVVGDAIPEPLAAMRGDPARGRAIMVNRQVGLCLLCHSQVVSLAIAMIPIAPSVICNS